MTYSEEEDRRIRMNEAVKRHRAKHPVKLAYNNHKQNARRRGVPFKLTFDEWKTIWEESGKFDQRGHSRGTYCMSRFGDKGAYEVGNVAIIPFVENLAEKNRGFRGKQRSETAKERHSYTLLYERKFIKRNGRFVWAKPGDPDYC